MWANLCTNWYKKVVQRIKAHVCDPPESHWHNVGAFLSVLPKENWYLFPCSKFIFEEVCELLINCFLVMKLFSYDGTVFLWWHAYLLCIYSCSECNPLHNKRFMAGLKLIWKKGQKNGQQKNVAYNRKYYTTKYYIRVWQILECGKYAPTHAFSIYK